MSAVPQLHGGSSDGGLWQCSYCAREMIQLGAQPKPIAPGYVKPFIKRQKNDAANAEAIVETAQRPTMRFVEPKT